MGHLQYFVIVEPQRNQFPQDIAMYPRLKKRAMCHCHTERSHKHQSCKALFPHQWLHQQDKMVNMKLVKIKIKNTDLKPNQNVDVRLLRMEKPLLAEDDRKKLK